MLLMQLGANVNDVVFYRLNQLHVAVEYRCEDVAIPRPWRRCQRPDCWSFAGQERYQSRSDANPARDENRDLSYNMNCITFKLADICLFAGADVSIPNPESFLPLHRAVHRFGSELIDAI